ncbi:hypothetical protein E2C01_045980 [Portunus trituberculatus]|uniref:Uncharacterized protein n=1 Tax=Portunus trituberculatus TaxID=210409 RepID=A0A5B7G3J8_PORTR|nr:hypothetical protein [Portunus trituberculatus]
MPWHVPPRPVDAGADPGGAVVSQAAATGWPSFSEEVDEVFDDVPLGEGGTPDEEGVSSFYWGRAHLWDFMTWPHYLGAASFSSGSGGLQEQLGCSLGISNPASAKFTLPRRASGLRLIVPLVPDTLHQLRILRFCPLLLLRDPPLSSVPVEFLAYRRGLDRHSALEAAVSDMLIKGAIEQVADPQARFYSRVLLVPVSTGAWRLICDLSILYRFLVVTHFRKETVSSVLESMAKGEWMVSLDLWDAYYQVLVHPRSCKYRQPPLNKDSHNEISLQQMFPFTTICLSNEHQTHFNKILSR